MVANPSNPLFLIAALPPGDRRRRRSQFFFDLAVRYSFIQQQHDTHPLRHTGGPIPLRPCLNSDLRVALRWHEAFGTQLVKRHPWPERIAPPEAGGIPWTVLVICWDRRPETTSAWADRPRPSGRSTMDATA
jgi:hypothetical protein